MKVTKRASVLWTGGKDCVLALHKAKALGYNIVNLVTFAPPKDKFRAHPLKFMELQAEALGIPHYTINVNRPFRKSYEDAICFVKKKYAIDTLVTGDINEVDHKPNWIKECSKKSGVKVVIPLWHKKRKDILNEFIKYKIKFIFSCVKEPWFTQSWLGKISGKKIFKDLAILGKQKKVDLCGENGEYHTLVLNCPLFKKSIMPGRSVNKKNGPIMYLDIKEIFLKDKKR